MFKGSLVALITPMHADGSVDEKAMEAFVDWQITEGTDGLVPVGTTGESPTLSHAEHKRVVELTIASAAGRVPVIAGAGSNSTAEAIDFTRHAKQAGADRRPGGDAVLQQADPGRPVSALHGDRRRRRPADHHLQYSRPQCGRYECRDDGAARPPPEHRRCEGFHRQPGAPAAHSGSPAATISASFPARTIRHSRSLPPAAAAASR